MCSHFVGEGTGKGIGIGKSFVHVSVFGSVVDDLRSVVWGVWKVWRGQGCVIWGVISGVWHSYWWVLQLAKRGSFQ